jgi:hypothetical protein
VFLVNSRSVRFAAADITASAPSPEVTGPFCLVP